MDSEIVYLVIAVVGVAGAVAGWLWNAHRDSEQKIKEEFNIDADQNLALVALKLRISSAEADIFQIRGQVENLDNKTARQVARIEERLTKQVTRIEDKIDDLKQQFIELLKQK